MKDMPLSLADNYESFLASEAKKYPGMVRDGIVDYDIFARQKIRILWILRETNDADGKCSDLREFLKSPTDYSKWKRTWLPVLQISHGILRMADKRHWGYEEIENEVTSHLSESLSVFRKVAVININKFSGRPSISSKSLREKYDVFQNTIINQVKLIRPDIVICGGVFWLMWKQRELFKVDNAEPDYSYHVVDKQFDRVRCHYNPHRIFIETSHPNQRRLVHQLYYESILKSANWWLKKYENV